jgi:EpsI family protein
MRSRLEWLPAGILAATVLLAAAVRAPRQMPLRAPLATVPDTLVGLPSVALELSPEELDANGASEYLLRAYHDGKAEQLGLYIGYYASQSQGRTIHSPKNCLPGGGWEPVSHAIVSVPVAGQGDVPVNRYLIARAGESAIVYYWYQGRGRVAASEYRVKWDLLRDAALRGRSEEALVRMVLPLTPTRNEAEADALARRAAATVVPALSRAFPT